MNIDQLQQMRKTSSFWEKKVVGPPLIVERDTFFVFLNKCFNFLILIETHIEKNSLPSLFKSSEERGEEASVFVCVCVCDSKREGRGLTKV